MWRLLPNTWQTTFISTFTRRWFFVLRKLRNERTYFLTRRGSKVQWSHEWVLWCLREGKCWCLWYHGRIFTKNSNCLDIKHPCKFFGLQGCFTSVFLKLYAYFQSNIMFLPKNFCKRPKRNIESILLADSNSLK